MAMFLDDVETHIAECLRDVRERIKYLGVTACSTREFADALRLHQQLREIERLVARAADAATIKRLTAENQRMDVANEGMQKGLWKLQAELAGARIDHD